MKNLCGPYCCRFHQNMNTAENENAFFSGQRFGLRIHGCFILTNIYASAKDFYLSIVYHVCVCSPFQCFHGTRRQNVHKGRNAPSAGATTTCVAPCRVAHSYTCHSCVALTQVELRVGDDAPARPVTEKAWLKSTGLLPLAADPSGSGTFLYVNYDSRDASDGGCDSPAHFEGCHVYYLKVLET